MPTRDPPRLHPIAALAAAAFPGAGYLVLGQPIRALAAAVGVLGLFFGGLFIGGIDVVDSKEDRIWFFGQAMVGPLAFGVDHLHQTRFKAMGPDLRRPGGPIVLRTGYPGEVRDATTTPPSWRAATPAEAAAGAGPPNVKSVSRVNEIGTLYATIAGMLNLILILDALLPTRRRGEGGTIITPEGGLAGAAAAVIVGGAAS